MTQSSNHDNLRLLNQPQPMAVRTDANDAPIAIRSRGRVYRVVHVIDTWRSTTNGGGLVTRSTAFTMTWSWMAVSGGRSIEIS